MANHPQNSPRGLRTFKKVNLVADAGTVTALTANSSGIVLDRGVKVSGVTNGQLTADSTGLVLPGSVKVTNARYIGANSTGYTFTAQAAKPTTRTSAKWSFITNSTGVNGILINTTGTTWKFVNVTTLIPS